MFKSKAAAGAIRTQSLVPSKSSFGMESPIGARSASLPPRYSPRVRRERPYDEWAGLGSLAAWHARRLGGSVMRELPAPVLLTVAQDAAPSCAAPAARLGMDAALLRRRL